MAELRNLSVDSCLKLFVVWHVANHDLCSVNDKSNLVSSAACMSAGGRVSNIGNSEILLMEQGRNERMCFMLVFRRTCPLQVDWPQRSGTDTPKSNHYGLDFEILPCAVPSQVFRRAITLSTEKFSMAKQL